MCTLCAAIAHTALRSSGKSTAHSDQPLGTIDPQVVPSTAIGFTIYDYMKSALGLPTHL